MRHVADVAELNRIVCFCNKYFVFEIDNHGLSLERICVLMIWKQLDARSVRMYKNRLAARSVRMYKNRLAARSVIMYKEIDGMS